MWVSRVRDFVSTGAENLKYGPLTANNLKMTCNLQYACKQSAINNLQTYLANISLQFYLCPFLQTHSMLERFYVRTNLLISITFIKTNPKAKSNLINFGTHDTHNSIFQCFKQLDLALSDVMESQIFSRVHATL